MYVCMYRRIIKSCGGINFFAYIYTYTYIHMYIYIYMYAPSYHEGPVDENVTY